MSLFNLFLIKATSIYAAAAVCMGMYMAMCQERVVWAYDRIEVEVSVKVNQHFETSPPPSYSKFRNYYSGEMF